MEGAGGKITMSYSWYGVGFFTLFFNKHRTNIASIMKLSRMLNP